MIIAFIILIIITLVSLLVARYCIKNKIELDTATKDANEKIQSEYVQLKNKYQDLSKENEILLNSISKEKKELEDIQHIAKVNLENQTELSQKAYENYWTILNYKYKETEKEYDDLIQNLKDSYSDLQLDMIAETGKISEELDKIRATRAAAIEAIRREKEMESNISFYCLEISDTDKADIARLEALKPSLNKPRVLSMLIWQTWFQKPLKALAANLNAIGKIGIYKITNIKTKECYIGQSVDIGGTRWVEHCKCGLGIDTPAGNKLYKAMQEYGLWNFSFEILEECPREQLNEKEKYYINLYDSYNFGYNQNKGINK